MACKIKASDFNKRIEIKTLSVVIGDGGQKADTWTTVDTLYAGVKTRSHAPLERAGKLEFITTTIFTTRYALTYLAARRIVYESRIFNVVRVVNVDERKQFIQYTCTEDDK